MKTLGFWTGVVTLLFFGLSLFVLFATPQSLSGKLVTGVCLLTNGFLLGSCFYLVGKEDGEIEEGEKHV